MAVKTRSQTITLSLYGFGLLWAFFILAPFYWLLMLSIKTPLDAFAVPPKLIFSPTFDSFTSIFSDEDFISAIYNSIIVACGSVILSLIIAVPAAFGLRNLYGSIRRTSLLIILLVRMVPGMVYLIPYFVIYNKVGLLDTHIGLILIHLIANVPLIIWMLTPIWASIPRELTEAARIDGATPFQILVKVDLPLLKGGILATSILAFIFSWNEFLFALIISRSDVTTLPVALVNFLAFEGTEWGKIAAASVFIVTPSIVFGFLVRRYMISGLSGGAVKG